VEAHTTPGRISVRSVIQDTALVPESDQFDAWLGWWDGFDVAPAEPPTGFAAGAEHGRWRECWAAA
jgi:hypothetical protein